jgi:hypothetical protein
MFTDTQKNLMAFDSITELASWANDNVPETEMFRRSSGKFWGQTDWGQVCARAAMGYDQAVPDAQKLLTQLQASINIETATFEASVAGCFPCVPEFLAGEPECMMDQVMTDSDTAPLAIYIDLTTSEGITADQFHKRGIAVLALTMLLSSIRPVSLHICTVMGADHQTAQMKKAGERYSIITARIETSPLDLGRAAFALTDVAVPRRLFYASATKAHSFDGMWPKLNGSSMGQSTSGGYVQRVRELLDVGSEVLYIPAVSLFTGEAAQMVNDPVAWINDKLAQYGGVTAEA